MIRQLCKTLWLAIVLVWRIIQFISSLPRLAKAVRARERLLAKYDEERRSGERSFAE